MGDVMIWLGLLFLGAMVQDAGRKIADAINSNKTED